MSAFREDCELCHGTGRVLASTTVTGEQVTMNCVCKCRKPPDKYRLDENFNVVVTNPEPTMTDQVVEGVFRRVREIRAEWERLGLSREEILRLFGEMLNEAAWKANFPATTPPAEPEWETANERTVKWDREQTAYLYQRLGIDPDALVEDAKPDVVVGETPVE